jgi:hypothetical protein
MIGGGSMLIAWSLGIMPTSRSRTELGRSS